MKLAYNWFKSLLDITDSPEALGDILTMLGFELEEILEDSKGIILDVNGMANRGDAFCLLGLARELRAKKGYSATELYKSLEELYEKKLSTDTTNNKFKIDVKAEGCSRYCYRIIDNIPKVDTPDWMVNILEQSGIRPISLIVDITNFVLLELGTPLHAFDYHKLSSDEITVRYAKNGEKLKLLNNEEVECREEDILIATPLRPLALAGVMGGLDSEVDEDTTCILLEAAHFNPSEIRNTRTRLGVSTESSYRFERWVDPNAINMAVERFTQLLMEITSNAPIVVETNDYYPNTWKTRNIRLDAHRVRTLLGMDVPTDKMEEYWRALGCIISRSGDSFEVTAPSWRNDIVESADLIEDIGRLHGYENIPEHPPVTTMIPGGLTDKYQLEDNIKECLVCSGFQQIISHTLTASSKLEKESIKGVQVRNPHSPELHQLRTSLLPMLASAAMKNGVKNLKLFEIGKVFSVTSTGYAEGAQLGILLHGDSTPVDWVNQNKIKSNFFHLKGVLDSVFSALNIDVKLTGEIRTDHRFHPYQSALVIIDEKEAGVFGKIHPSLAKELSLDTDTYIAEITLDGLENSREDIRDYKILSRNPSIRRDLALVCDKSLAYQDIERCIRKSAGDLLEKVWMFDKYEGDKLEEGKHSLGITIQLRKQGSNLNDEEANKVRDSILSELSNFGISLRS